MLQFRRIILALAAALFLDAGARADFTGIPITFKTDGGWSWFQDPRAIITNNQLVFGSVAGVTATGAASTLGDTSVSSYDLIARTSATPFLLVNQSDHDDHDVPAFAVLPDGRILTTYENHGGTNNVLWRVSTSPGEATSWSTQQSSVMNTTNDGNGNAYNNPFYLSTPNIVFNSSRSIGYDPNYAIFSSLGNATPTFTYGGHWMYWTNPNNGIKNANGGNGRPYVKYTSNGTDTVWFATTEDSPDNYDNSLYVGYIKFNNSGAGTVYNAAGTAIGPISTGTAPAVNVPNNGNMTSGTGKSYLPTAFTPVLQTNDAANNMTGKSVAWASSMNLDANGNPYIGIVVRDSLTDPAANDLEYYFAHYDGSSWQVSRLGYAGSPLYSGQPNYAGLLTVDPLDPNKVYISSDVDPVTDAALAHYQIFEGISGDNGSTWTWAQITNTAGSDNIRPVAVQGNGQEALLWMQGSYTTYQNFSTNIVGLVQAVPEPASTGLLFAVGLSLLRRTTGRRRYSKTSWQSLQTCCISMRTHLR